MLLRFEGFSNKFGRLKIQGPAVITADLIQLPPDLKIINPNHYIATISTSNILEIELGKKDIAKEIIRYIERNV